MSHMPREPRAAAPRMLGCSPACAVASALLGASPVRSALLLLLLLPSLGMVCGPIEPPPPDECSAPTGGSVGNLEIGPERGPEQSFEAWAPTDTAVISSGPQGGDMLGVTLRVTGDGPPACLAQRTRLTQGGRQIETSVPVHTYEEADGSRATRTLWLIFDDVPALGSEIEVRAEAGGQAASSRLTVVAERHRLVSLGPLAAEPRVGDHLEFAIEVRHAPYYWPMDISLESSNLAVLGDPPGLITLYEDRDSFLVPVVGAGTAEIIARYGEQELRAIVTVEE
jgi:hypothetical protein